MANQTHGSLAAQAASYLRESAGAVGGANGIQSEIDRQADCLLEWAWERGLTLADSYTNGLKRIEFETVEHSVYLRVSDNRVVKCTKPGRFGRGHGANGKYGVQPDATPLFYLERLEFMNQEFPTDIRLHGIGLGNRHHGNKEQLRPYAVTSQRYIEPSNKERPNPTEEEIAEKMKELGFKLLPDSIYNWLRESDGVVVTDAKMLNFIVSDEGILPIDVIIYKYPTLVKDSIMSTDANVTIRKFAQMQQFPKPVDENPK